MLKNCETCYLAIWKIYTFLMVGLAIIGGFRFYSPIPFMDMWNGYLDFYLRTLNGDTSVWWAQHNEHRIFLSRILYWLDIKYFQGLSYFLTAANYLILGFIALFFYKIFDDFLSKNNNSYIKKIIGYFLLALISSKV